MPHFSYTLFEKSTENVMGTLTKIGTEQLNGHSFVWFDSVRFDFIRGYIA